MQRFELNKRIYVSIAIYIVSIISLATYSYLQEKNHIYTALDLKLKTAALTITSLLPANFHQKEMAYDENSTQLNSINRTALSNYAKNINITNLYTLILRDNQILFTSSSLTPTENNNFDQSNTDFLTAYDDANTQVYHTFADQQARLIEYQDKWGRFRSIFIPLYSADGSLYIAAADITIDSVSFQLNQLFNKIMLISAIFMLAIFVLFFMQTVSYRQQVKKLRCKIAQRTAELVQSEAKLNSIFEHSPVGIFHYNKQGILLKTNRHFEDIIGAKKDGLIGFNMLENIKNKSLSTAMKSSLKGQISTFEGEYISISHRKKSYLEVDLVPLYSSTGEIDGGVGVCDDITLQQQNTSNLQKLSRVVECSLDGIMITNTKGVIEYVNPRFTQITGYSSKESVGEKANFFRSRETRNATYNGLWNSISNGNEWSDEMHNQRKNGELYWAKVTIIPMTNANDEITHFIGIQVDITESRIIAKQIAYQAKHDMLTGLINRYEFEHQLTDAVCSAQGSKLTHVLFFLDLDQFKIINDTCGHAAGDELLRQVAGMIDDNLKPNDILARLGGDEFAILMRNCQLKDAVVAANAILNKVKKFQFIWKKSCFSIGVSIGVAEISRNSGNTSEVLIHADLACYAAKDLGRNRVHTYNHNDKLLTTRDGEFRWVNEIKEALNEDRFELYAQPIVALSDSGHKHVFEVLLRMQAKDGKIIEPGTFLPIAERYSLSQPIDRWVFDHTLDWMREHSQQLDIFDHISINLSGTSLGDDDLLQHIMWNIAQAGLTPQQFMFEITETAAISNLTNATIFINTLSEFGCQFALDDFGSGLSSFAYLKNLPVNTLKIDGIFIKDILTNPIDAAMVKSINEIGHLMKLKTVAEFVENDAIKQKIKAIGIDFAQGYGIGKPQPIDNMLYLNQQ
ncbi:EAL domain-containing protein [Moritella viscosa]|uniref:PAS sensor diguanylate cyclase and phophodiesterase n=2 Tax=Moritella viscosa TaxID=80854 RepID=A0A1L0BSJ1_9GAMM|nr:EAL domain-containing protein [Moritella viscosa]SGZ07912.1 PAS sensor diguanylate cyclase and phophodiesterase [Moritella viscosa]SGZ17664.1 PAS sensor diguanylate cyclase and phophodiesterase [Moritella viscosa]SHN98899.1 PAS sensor diguanylate cyclase and phophodiesterase [Moritella viscosa]SHN98901.1 PAS sensor diguanylate cyclase and phophodiesterase [Moritella viscosa]SHN99980.1 PAS sensor diguanylate cyclase and phophodiesterase [Moritella viscosa]